VDSSTFEAALAGSHQELPDVAAAAMAWGVIAVELSLGLARWGSAELTHPCSAKWPCRNNCNASAGRGA